MLIHDAKQTALDCLEAWSSGDLERARELLHDDVTFVGPLGATEGRDAYVEGVTRLREVVTGVEVTRAVAEGDDVAISYDLLTSVAGVLPTVGWYEVRDGLVTSVRAYFDPRPLLGS